MKVTRFGEFTVALNCAVPAALLAWDACNGDLGANPVNFAIRTTGILSLIFLVLTLLVTPLSRTLGWSFLTPLRRVLGLFAFFHALAHFLIFYWFDRDGSVVSTLAEMVERPYLMVGSLGLVLMVPLAVTSTDSLIRRMGGKRWKALHRLVYVVAIAGVVHFTMLVKADLTRPMAFGVAVGVLLLYRVVSAYVGFRAKYRQLVAIAAGGSERMGQVGLARREGRFAAKRWSGRLRVARVFEETAEVRTFRLVAVGEERLPFDFLPGQYLNLSLMVDGKRVNRSYTIASSPTRVGYCELTVKREADGVASRHLHETVGEGTLLDVSAPAGRFVFTGGDDDSIVMIAGGVGITPLMAKIRYLTDISWSGEIVLVFAVRTEADIIFREELEYLGRRFPNLRVVVTLTRDDGEAWKGWRGRIGPELLNEVVPGIEARRVHVCGPDEMAKATLEILRGLGVREEFIALESFTPNRRTESLVLEPVVAGGVSTMAEATFIPEAENGVEVAASITFARSGKSKRILGNETVLEAAEGLGVEIAYDCRAGICGQCKTRLLSGRVMMEAEDALDAVDRMNNVILSCQAHCVGDVVVEA